MTPARASILALGLYQDSGGPSKSVRAFANALDASVISWVGATSRPDHPLIWDHTTVVKASRLPVLRQLLYAPSRSAHDAERLVSESGLVSCHSFWRWHVRWLAQVAKRHGVPYWFVPHGSLDPYVFQSDRVFKRLFLRTLGRDFLAGASAVVCSATREYEKLAHLVPHARPAIIHWPLADHDFRDRCPQRRAACRRSLGIPDDAFCFLYFGRLDPMKRPLETIDAFAAGAEEHAHLIMMGDDFGVGLEECRRRASTHGVADRVHVIGPKYGEERLPFMDAADIYVSLSHRENFNYTAMECLASGMPIILSPGNDIAGDIASVGCGWMMTTESKVADVFRDVIATPPSDLERMGAAGRGWADSNLRYSTFQERIAALAAACGRAS